MSEVYLTRRGNNTKLFAAIVVTYPEGSVCTCSNGTKILTAKNTSGQCVFIIPEPTVLPENWVITATDGTNTKSQNVEIISEGQFEAIELLYEYYVFKTGSGAAGVLRMQSGCPLRLPDGFGQKGDSVRQPG